MNLENRKQAIRQAHEALHAQPAQSGGRMTVLERMQRLFDEGTFIETNAFITQTGNILAESERLPEGVVTGYGAVDGRLVFAFAQDYSRDQGAIGLAGANKIAALYRTALQNGAPVVGMFDSDGAKLQEGTNALAAYGILFKAAADAKFKIPRISVVSGTCSGANAVLAAEADIVITAGENAAFSLASVSALQSLGASAETGTGIYAAQSGLAAAAAATEAESLLNARALLSYLPSNKKDKVPAAPCSDPAERAVAETAGAADGPYDMKTLVAQIADNGVFHELYSDFASDIVTGFAFINGASCGIVATNPVVNNSRITAAGAKKAGEFVDLCSAFSLPVLTLVDSVGYCGESELQNAAAAKEVARLAASYAKASPPMVTVITGKATGSVFSVLGSKALGADLVLALPSAQIEVMDTDAAVNFLWNGALAEADDAEEAREELKNKWEQEMSTPLNAAKNGHVDFICEEKELRARIASALSMLAMKRHFWDFS
ncbi:MAG: hypothetical protein LBS36_03885 [Oscillospiraceae bacterium]|jgi:acetyl-CoA carboxylase carboxyltransferase component|nr:hypothetical protein [Oscillospiraceae bacterium]